MKKLLFLIPLIPSVCFADCRQTTRAYNTATTVDFCLFTTDATVGAVKVESAVHASGDTYIMKDEGAEANTTSGFTDEGSCYSIALTATELTAARVVLNIEDQSTKTWSDECVVIETYGNASAQHLTPDVNVSSISAGAITATAIATDAITSAEIAADAIGASELATDAIGSAEVSAAAATEIGGECVGGEGGGSGGNKGQN